MPLVNFLTSALVSLATLASVAVGKFACLDGSGHAVDYWVALKHNNGVDLSVFDDASNTFSVSNRERRERGEIVAESVLSVRNISLIGNVVIGFACLCVRFCFTLCHTLRLPVESNTRQRTVGV
jgi:hypothetical protein